VTAPGGYAWAGPTRPGCGLLLATLSQGPSTDRSRASPWAVFGRGRPAPGGVPRQSGPQACGLARAWVHTHPRRTGPGLPGPCNPPSGGGPGHCAGGPWWPRWLFGAAETIHLTGLGLPPYLGRHTGKLFPRSRYEPQCVRTAPPAPPPGGAARRAGVSGSDGPDGRKPRGHVSATHRPSRTPGLPELEITIPGASVGRVTPAACRA